MMTQEMMKQMPHMMMDGASQMLHKPLTTGAMMAGAGFAAGRGLLLRSPLMLLAAGVAGGIAAGFLLHKYQKEIIDGASKLSGMGKDFALHQKENLADLMAEAEDKGQDTPPAAAAPAAGDAPAA
ncbi:hypothetical protein [Azonexus sp.]|uniref:hypothetical protein n=1 Tax=Azonexus sp. TaxID=1872668 RepID=UPI0035AE6484